MRHFLAYVTGLVLFLVQYAYACGPSFPNSYLLWSDELSIDSMPEANFWHEISLLAGVVTTNPSRIFR